MRKHPLANSRGIFSNLLADELGVNTYSWGRYLNGNRSLKTMPIGVGGNLNRRIFLAITEEPKARVARILEAYEHQHGTPLIRTGVPVADIAADASIQKLRLLEQDERSLHHSIGKLLDRKQYVTDDYRDGNRHRLVYAKGHTPREQVARAIGEFSEEDFQRGVPLDKVATKVHFQQDDWDESSLHQSIGRLLDRKKYVTYYRDGKTFVYLKPRE